MISFPLIAIFSACFDKQALRQEDQEKALLYENAQRHWEGRRWNIPSRAAAFYEDPLVRARQEGVLKQEKRKFTDISVLHVTLDEKTEEDALKVKEQSNPEKMWLRTGTVFVRVEGFGKDNVLTVEEQQQRWYPPRSEGATRGAPEAKSAPRASSGPAPARARA